VSTWDTNSTETGGAAERGLAAFRDAGFKKKWFDPMWKTVPVAEMKIPPEFLSKKVQRYDKKGAVKGKALTLRSFMTERLGASARQAEGYAPYRGELLSERSKVRVNETDGPKSLKIPEFIDWINKFGGFRFLSNSDFQPEHAVDHAQALMHLDFRKSRAHGYTNLPDWIEIFHKTGIKQNMSVYMDVVDGKVVGRKNQGMPLEKALELQKKSDNAGIVLIAHNAEVLKWARENPDIQYVLPAHLGMRQNKILSPLQWKSFGYGMEKFRDASVDVKKLPKDLQQHVYLGGDGKHHIRIKMEAHTNLKAGDKPEAMWRKYKRICDRLGCTYRFEGTPEIFGEVKGDPKKHKPLPGYMKFVVDFARWDTPQKPINARRIDYKKMADVVRRKLEDPTYTGHDGERGIGAEDMMAVMDFLKANKGKGATGLVHEAEKIRMDALRKELR